MLITVDELKSRLNDEHWVVLDCRFTLNQPDAGRRAYLEGHIPGAYYLDLEQDLSGPRRAHGGRHPLPDPEELAEKLAAAGVTDGVRVVVYDAGGGMAQRAWWLIRYLGHDAVSVLDGGYPAWVAAGGSVTDALPEARPAAFTPRLRREWIASVEEVAAVSKGERPGVLIDARAGARFRGEVEPIDRVAGHIPGARNAPWEEGVGPDGRWKAAEAQRDRFRFVQNPAEVICYCGSGVTACANLFAMALAGLEGARLYPGSWSDWISYPDNPVATGDA
ncbi:sulfurtransferase [Alicyclobacillus sp.]|uniref:sulfurtransferase n=1 Tax=Alicyclobacillus sp. TaxID=61169 RepID=UPI00345782BB